MSNSPLKLKSDDSNMPVNKVSYRILVCKKNFIICFDHILKAGLKTKPIFIKIILLFKLLFPQISNKAT